MIRKVIIVLLQQIICHGCWAFRPTQSLASTLVAVDKTILVTKTTAKIPLFSQSYIPNGNKIILIETNCTRELFEVKFKLGSKFHGIVFAKDFPDECRLKGNMTTWLTLKLATSSCGIRSELKSDGIIKFSVKVILQMDSKLRQSSDIEKIVSCNLPTTMMSLDVADGSELQTTYYRNSRMRQYLKPQTTPRVRVWLELGGTGGIGIVEVGQPTTLSIRAIVPGNIGIRIIDCAALDGLGESSQKLLDKRGCPIDEQVMPALHTKYRPAEEGWSKPSDDDLVERLFTATFPAFKFPDRERLHVSCGVQLCKKRCPKVNCLRGEEFILKADEQLARIEVFNSLAVTAPQIEIDNVEFHKSNNMSVEEYPPKVKNLRNEGTLCLSISKLALAFCILGLIFLIAIVVSVICLLRSRARNENDSLKAASTSVFSTSSGSHSRFGSKLLVGHGGSFPYGRVF